MRHPRGTKRAAAILAAAIMGLVAGQALAAGAEMPRLQKNHGVWQLMVDGKPFLMRGGEFSNNVYEAPKDLPLLEMMLDAYKGYDLNTVLVPISWRTLEPQEGTFDFRMIDTLIEQCRKRDMRVVVLWFGAIKNGHVGYAPRWVSGDRKRFFRATTPAGKETGAVSPFCEAAWTADRRAFVKLMEHIKEKDAGHYTVVMVQPENETGCQEIDNTRDQTAAATQGWESAVPEDLTKYLAAHDGRLVKWLQQVWDRAGKKTAGTWAQVFGEGSDGQKIFMSYSVGKFIEHVAGAGKEVYPLPMFINDWLGSIESPGGPIGGPEYHVMDVFRVTTPSSFSCAADIYQPNFKAWVAAFDQKENPILIPEAHADARAAEQCWFTYFQHDGMLFSPYLRVPNESDQKVVPQCLTYSNLKMSYEVIKEMDELILARQGLVPRELICFELDKNEKPESVFAAEFQGYAVKAQATRPYGNLWEGDVQETPGFAAIVKMGPDDFVLIGKTMRVEFQKPGLRLKSAARGRFASNRWVPGAALSAEAAANQVKVQLTEAPKMLDVIRLQFTAE
jgi:hypothetical protein